MKTIDYYFWLNSDWAYLGADRLEALAARQQARIRYLPVDLPEVYARTGGVLLGQRAPERQAYRVTELARWCRKLGIHVNATPAHMCPDAGLASRLVIAADAAGLPVAALYKAILAAEWCEERDISSPDTLRAILREQGLDAGALMAAAEQPAARRAYRDNTDAAVAAGVFGSPSYVYRGELFWGQDRLEMLEEAVAASR
ncbi:2-hydroxychromene-2-carboxylate isomerase [Achromobacter xylosoxidans]|uniref:2-hydroxychromene-2-carboxylate isomerase n=1 Tax=Alcaligenes xylosoxydans xylosoxydans TaxID=85698 RepID=UPI0006C0F01A|nr:2-hydroxychromene-2-carboxylate isomerase [Achromobacter xylosoxidans]CUK15994.1 2-hydroxychromene-2-carboxylate isomerase [Achromobacter xylosoxidans]